MKEFLMAALPWVAIGIAVALLCVFRGTKVQSYLTEGMCLGMCMGITISSITKLDLGTGISLGLLFGEVTGSFFRKKK